MYFAVLAGDVAARQERIWSETTDSDIRVISCGVYACERSSTKIGEIRYVHLLGIIL